MQRLFSRLSEPSTHAAISAAVPVVFQMMAGTMPVSIGAGALVTAALGVLLSEKGAR